MSKKRKPKMEYRYYEIPSGMPVLALLGEKWIQNYGRDIDYLHFHNHLEIGYCYYGEGILTLEEDAVVFGKETFSIIPKNFPHTTNSTGKSFSAWEYLFIDVDGFLQEKLADNPHMADKMIRRINRKAHFYKTSDKPELAVYIRQIIEIMRDRKEFYQEEVKGVIFSLLMAIARMNRDTKEEKGTAEGNSTVLSRSLDYISENYNQQIKIEELAEMSHISETHYRRIFSETLRMTPVEYINRVRIKNACDELKRTNDSVGAIAVRAGFGTLSTFNRNFHRIVGISPQQWRKDPEHYERKLLEYNIEANEGW
ncbi:MAG: AraC family transcriptional regulator [Clostridia bacterium]|nr:AraC family transcriptional regulator [Clostridia bacterium]NCC42832.1 AraC family transcriptional regulator [Clostridia bacterium]